MKKIAILALSALSIAGCQSTPELNPIPANVQSTLLNQWVTTEVCYNNGFYSLEEHTSYQSAINYNLGTWKINQASIDTELIGIRSVVNQNIANGADVKGTCHYQKPVLVRTLNEAQSHYNQVQTNQQRAHEIQKAKASAPRTESSISSFGGTVNCKKIGAFIQPEIKTFQGMMCPIGWFPA
ncbi:hypothetical protein [Photobacterium lutimaris]|uniref:Lipoprotein n=1 Tax=Photobacterium lutimaris TaxID=388278 RepID=A0A2T3J4I1_9GAMM|nr:hypothetical protein [Photobacterium lutimaris]PSU36205.1 hypothetical protein C9I99_04180 [Photobacterium lutimaris]TDR74924.1 hypothetical protein DFP78_106255 [Photobacterium lutimaris]